VQTTSRVTAYELRELLVHRVRALRRTYAILIAVFVLATLGICAHAIYYYNYLTGLQYDVRTARAQVSTAIQYRRNLLPTMIETLVSFVEHEDDVFGKAIDAREREFSPASALAGIKEEILSGGDGSQEAIGDALQRIVAIAEQYPALVTSEAFQLLMKEVAAAEAQILARRLDYNNAWNSYSTAMSMFPGNAYARLFEFPGYDYFEDVSTPEWPSVQITGWRAVTPGGGDASAAE
jgi:LemA protein